MPESHKRDIRVAIVGGGMCGILSAVGLTKVGITVDIFEAIPKFEEVGAGVGFGSNAIRALDALGVLDIVLSHSNEPTLTYRPFRFVSGYGEHEHIYDYPILPQDHGLGIYRPAFLNALTPLLDPSIIHFNKRCVSISPTSLGGHIIRFEDGTTHEADLIIGADGVRSMTRGFVTNNVADHLVFSNTIAYRGLVSAEILESEGVKTDLRQRPICFVGHDKHIVTFPILPTRIINIVAYSSNYKVPIGSIQVPSPWVVAVPEQELLDEYTGWGEDAKIILKQMKRPNKWYIHCLNPPLKSYVHQRVVLVGDAHHKAHAMPPHLGSGAGQGFEDVFVLCALLGHPQTKAENLGVVLRAYDAIRVPRANMVLERSALAGEIYDRHGENDKTVEELRQRLTEIWGPVWHHDLVKEVNSVIEHLHTTRKAYL